MNLQDEIGDIVKLEDILDSTIISLSLDTPARLILFHLDPLNTVKSACTLHWESISRYLARPTTKTVNDEDLQDTFR
jgi:hypothetical protein